MIKYIMNNLLPPLTLAAGVLGYIFVPRDLMDIGSALGDWIKLLPFGPEILPQILFLTLTVFGAWRLVQLHILPPYAHRLHPWRNDRISIVEFARIAHRDYGWWTDANTLEMLDLIDGIGQAVADGTVQIYGRFNPERYSNLRTIYIVPIPKGFWRRNYVEAYDALVGGDNLASTSCPYGDRKIVAYMDLHLNRIQALAWLAGEGKSWKGRMKREDQRRRAHSVAA